MTVRVPGQLSRRRWRRMEREVVADHELAVLTSIRRLAQMGHEVQLVVPTTERPSHLGIVILYAGAQRVTMAGVAAVTRAQLATHDQTVVSLADAGRYGPLWWVRLVGSGHVASTDHRWNAAVSMTITGSHLRADPDPGPDGSPSRPVPAPGWELADGAA